MAELPPRVWITRTLPEAKSTAKAVADLGCDPIIAPMLEVTRLRVDWPKTLPDAVILTSAHALEALREDGPLKRLAHLPLFVVGERLKAKAITAGFNGPAFAAPTAEALLEMIAARMPPAARLLYLAPREPAVPLNDWLTDKGFQVVNLIVYETQVVTPDASIASEAPLFVMLHSPKAASAVGHHIKTNIIVIPGAPGHGFRLDVLTFICISEAARSALISGLDSAGASGVCCYVAATPDEAGLLACLQARLRSKNG
jgi:uroporphyrinogen-III synthase